MPVASGKTVTDGRVEGTQCLLFQDQVYNITHKCFSSSVLTGRRRVLDVQERLEVELYAVSDLALDRGQNVTEERGLLNKETGKCILWIG